MITIDHTEVYGFEAAIRGMRNPKNSWDRSDSGWVSNRYVIGDNDLKLMAQLVTAGTDHAKFMRYINVTCDITAPMYWASEFDTYKIGTVRNSCSKMHKITAKEIIPDLFAHEYIDKTDPIIQEAFEINLSACELLRKKYLELRESKNIEGKTKDIWYALIQLLPESYLLKFTTQLNYSVLRSMYHARKNHKLDEWHDFCSWIESLPYSFLITAHSPLSEVNKS